MSVGRRTETPLTSGDRRGDALSGRLSGASGTLPRVAHLRRSRLLLSCLVVVVALGGCASAANAGRYDLVMMSDQIGQNEALIAGTLIARDRCLFLERATVAHPIAWPSGTTQDGTEITTPDGSSYEVGEPMEASGGYGDQSSIALEAGDETGCLSAEHEMAVVAD